MSINISRRKFIQGIGAGLGIIAAPSLSSLIPIGKVGEYDVSPYSYDGGIAPELDTTLDRLLLRKTNPFEAYANSSANSTGRATFAGSFQLLAFGAAAVTILEWLGVESKLSKYPDYSEAAQCETCFRNAQHDLESRDVRLFTDIKRSPQADELAIMAGGIPTKSGQVEIIQAATQYRALRAIALKGYDAGILVAASNSLREFYPGDNSLFTYGVTAVDKQIVSFRDRPATRIETPITTLLHSPEPSREPQSGRLFNGGTLFLHRKKDQSNPDNLYWAGLYT